MNLVNFKFLYRISAFCCIFFSVSSIAQQRQNYIVNHEIKDGFSIANNGKSTTILISENDFSGVQKVGKHLQNDIFKVTGNQPNLVSKIDYNTENIIIIGTIGKGTIIDKLIENGKFDATSLTGKWEKFISQVVENPIKGVKKALIIAGSDKRGTIYGMYHLSEQIGVSPWYYWADVPIKKQTILYARPGTYTLGEPKVKYRGIFLNDEAPALTGWAFENFGGFNAQFYEHVFELILRLKGNYLWPAMWGKMFYVDDPKNATLADEYGIVMGTSHHEPLTRAHTEWEKFGNGKWDFNKNATELKKFWTAGMERLGNKEAIVTIGMRGDGDEPMTQGTAISLLEDIVKNQREIIKKTTKKHIEETPQMWALYKEVQDYYDKGMRVPDDVTLLLCDDNWGNIRKLPTLNSSKRKGGYGIYYHFDYVGGPRNYKWINTTQIERVWEQMHMAYEFDAKQVWIVNVGDLKPMEFPISFFLDFAWNPEAINANDLPNYYSQWIQKNLGNSFTKEISKILSSYTKYNARVKPELLSDKTYSLVNYNEAENVVSDYKNLAKKATDIYTKIPTEYKNAYYQLILFPVLASANLYELYLATAKNRLYFKQGRASTNRYQKKVKEHFDYDAELTDYYHKNLSDGKWNHMMAQTHIGYTYWQQPEKNAIPETKNIKLKDISEMGISIEGTANWFPDSDDKAILPTFYSFDKKPSFIEVFNRGKIPFDYHLETDVDWIQFSKKKGKIATDERIYISIDWSKILSKEMEVPFYVVGNNKKIPVYVKVKKIDVKKAKGFLEKEGYIAINAQNFSRKKENNTTWEIISNLGKTTSSITNKPSTSFDIEITKDSPRLEFDVHLLSQDSVKVHAYFSPTINFTETRGLKFGIGFDNEQPKIINFNEKDSFKNWEKSVANNIKIVTSSHVIKNAGNHTLKYYLIDSGLVLQKIVIETNGVKETYLGPPESTKKNN